MKMRWFLLLSGFSAALVLFVGSASSQTNNASEAQWLDSSEVLHKDGILRISDGSSYYEFKTNGTFRSFPVAMSGRCFDGTWTSIDDIPHVSRFTMKAESSWMNGEQPLPHPPADDWKIVFVVYAGNK